MLTLLSPPHIITEFLKCAFLTGMCADFFTTTVRTGDDGKQTFLNKPVAEEL